MKPTASLRSTISETHPALFYSLKATNNDQANESDDASYIRLQYPRLSENCLVESPRSFYLVSEFDPLNIPNHSKPVPEVQLSFLIN
jgi:hypothetical protein